MWELDHKEGWALKNWCFWTVVLKKTLESPLDCKEIQPVQTKGDQSWVFIGRTDDEAEAPILWPPHVKSWLTGKDPDAGRDWGQEEKGTTEDKMAGWHHRLDGHEFEQTLGVCDGQGGLACSDSWGCNESDMTEWLNWTELNWIWVILKVNVKALVAQSCLFVTPKTAAHQAPLSMGFSRQEYWSGLPCPPPGGSSWPRDRTLISRIIGRFFTVWATREAWWIILGGQ